MEVEKYSGSQNQGLMQIEESSFDFTFLTFLLSLQSICYLIFCLLFDLQKMDLRRKNFKENKQNSSSMAEFSKNVEQSFRTTPDLNLRTKVKQLEMRLNILAETQKLESQKNRGQNLKLEGSVSLVEKQLAVLDRDRTRISNKNEVGKSSRIRPSVQRSLKTLEKAESSQIMMMDLATQKEELRIQKMKCEQLQTRQLRFEQDVKELLENKLGRNCIKLEVGGLQAQRSEANKQIKYYSQLYSKSRTQATQKIEVLSHGLEQSLATFKEDLKNFKREEILKLEEELKGPNNGELRQSRIYQKDQTAEMGNNDLSSWKKSIELKIARLCEELTCSMKGSKQYWRKEHDELAKETLETAKSIVQVRQALSKKLEKEVKGVTAVMSEEFNTFLHELEQINELVSLAKKQLQTKIQSESNNLKQLINEVSSFTHSRMGELQIRMGKSLQDSNRHLKKEISKINKLTSNQIESVASIEQSLHKVSKTNDDTEKVNKIIEALKTEVEGKLKAAYDRMILDWTVKKQFEQKAKAEQAKQRQIKDAELQKKLSDLSGKIKIELRSEFAKKAERNSKEEMEGINKQIEKYLSQLKKQLQVQMEEDKKLASDEINRIKFEMKAKEQMYNPENTAKRENERKKKEEQLRLKLQSITNQIKETTGKLRGEIQIEVSRLKSSQHEQIIRIKNGFESNIRLVEESIKRKESEAKIKQQQQKRRQVQSNTLQQQFDHKLKGIKLQLEEYTVKGLGRLKTEVDGKIGKVRQQATSNIKALEDKVFKDHQEIISRIEEISQKGDQIQVNVESKLAELKGISLINMKAQGDEARNAQQRKLKNLENQLCKTFDSKAQVAQSQIKLLKSKLDQLEKEELRVKAEVGNFLVANQNAINKLEASHFSEKQKNKAVYDKMSSDILDIADSLMVMMSELKPPQK